MLTDGTGRYCNGGLHSLFTSCSGFKICFLDFFRDHDNDVAAFAKLSHLTYVRTVTYGRVGENPGNEVVVALNLEKGFFAVATYYWH